jgi:hypothetical protein
MTIDELYNLCSILYHLKVGDSVKIDDIDKQIEVIEREIKLKTINPTTGKPNELHRNDV